jgi:hypothetical protein
MGMRTVYLKRVAWKVWQLRDVNGVPYADVQGKRLAEFLRDCLEMEEVVRSCLNREKQNRPRNSQGQFLGYK